MAKRRIELPSGKIIEIREDPLKVDANYGVLASKPLPLHVCVACGCEQMHPIQWEEHGTSHWWVINRCPECEARFEFVASEQDCQIFDDIIEEQVEDIERIYRRMVTANLAEEVDRFVTALQADAILPFDF